MKCGRITVSRTGREHVGLREAPGAQQAVHDRQLRPRAQDARLADGGDVRAQPVVARVQLEPEQVHFQAVEVGVDLHADGEREAQALGLREDGAALPGVRTQGVVVGDRQRADASGSGLLDDLEGRELAVAHQGVQVEVGRHPSIMTRTAARRLAPAAPSPIIASVAGRARGGQPLEPRSTADITDLLVRLREGDAPPWSG
jgi:hypothetical protein